MRNTNLKTMPMGSMALKFMAIIYIYDLNFSFSSFTLCFIVD